MRNKEFKELLASVKEAGEIMRGKRKPSSLWEKIDGLIQKIPAKEWSKLPRDGAKNIDRYLYKR